MTHPGDTRPAGTAAGPAGRRSPAHLTLLGAVAMLAAVATTAMCGRPATPGLPAEAAPCGAARDLRLTNGQIVTMDGDATIVSEVTVQDGRFVFVGPGDGSPLNPCTREIDLGGHTVVPGLIDNHNHIVLLGIRPGHDTRLENARSIADVQAAIRARATGVPAGEFITAMGGWNPAQFEERRLPTLAELDQATPDHPVLVFLSFTGPSVTNTPGRAFFTERGIEVGADGTIGPNAASIAALNALRAEQTFEDRRRGTLDALSYSARVGVTTDVDMGAFNLPGTPDLQGSFEADTLASADQFRMYDAVMSLHREGRLPVRVRLYFLTMDTGPDNPVLADRLRNSHYGAGDDMLRFSGIGEFATSWPLFGQPPPTNYVSALQLVADHGWAFQQHSLSPAENQLTLEAFEAVNEHTPIGDLRWSIAHVGTIDEATIARFRDIGAGVAVHPFQFLAGGRGGPPLRTIVDSGVRVGAGSDSAQISTLNPWNMIAYMVTGRASDGSLINDGQQLTRMEALRLYTVDNGWFLREEDTLGSIEAGKLADLVVLNEDYFDPVTVPDEAIRDLHSVLTVVDGRVVYDALPAPAAEE